MAIAPADVSTETLPVYLDCAATTPIDPRVLEVAYHYMSVDFGNAGSHHHIYGTRARKAVETARTHIANVVEARPEEVIFTSGATESNNLATLGLAPAARQAGKLHIVSTAIEHKAVLEPLKRLEAEGFEVSYVSPGPTGWVSPSDVLDAVRSDTFLVSVMHVNNETGVIQPLREIADGLANHCAYFHTDASQGFGKEHKEITSRIDLISASSHKLYGPKGVGCLIARRRGFKRPPLSPLCVGGGQERGLRSGTIPTGLCAAFGEASRIALAEHESWEQSCNQMERILKATLTPFEPELNGDTTRKISCILNVSFPELDSEAVILALKDIVAISNGSACTTADHRVSHVLREMGLGENTTQGATRWSWSHLTENIPSQEIAQAIRQIL